MNRGTRLVATLLAASTFAGLAVTPLVGTASASPRGSGESTAVAVSTAQKRLSAKDSRLKPLPGGLTVGVGPTGDPIAMTLPLFFWGTAVPKGNTYLPVFYPALMAPTLVTGITMTNTSVGIGEVLLRHALRTVPSGTATTVIGMSQGCFVVDRTRVSLKKGPNSPKYRFLLLGNPLRPNGGASTRGSSIDFAPLLPFKLRLDHGWPIVDDLPSRITGLPIGRPKSDGDFPTVDVSTTYDAVSDFPAYANPLSIVNAVAGIAFSHVFPGYALVDPNASNNTSTTIGNTTYVTIPSRTLPILYPFRQIASLSGNTRYVDALDPVLRLLIEAGYDRGADPAKVKGFTIVTPQSKINEVRRQLPKAYLETLAVLAGKPLPIPVIEGSKTPSTGPEIKATIPGTLNDPLPGTTSFPVPDPNDPLQNLIGMALTGDAGKRFGGPFGLSLGGAAGKLEGYAEGASVATNILARKGVTPKTIDEALLAGDTAATEYAIRRSGKGRITGSSLGGGANQGIVGALRAGNDTMAKSGSLPAGINAGLTAFRKGFQKGNDEALADSNNERTSSNSARQSKLIKKSLVPMRRR
ncbi:PE-PPE domain-containing protein [Gordonia sp. CPCC 205333]|uniref:PE-PPE domain-containing protein n=1 Tax=Gordonia sp. CPCC 205333 TaxID=3140790 RepID=UPI003AF36CBA